MKSRRPKEIRELDAKVQKLQRYLLTFYKRKIKKLAATQGIPVEFFIQRYQEEIEIQLRVFIEDIYMTRIKNLEQSILKKRRSKSASIRDIFTSLKDIDNIKQIVSAVKDKFFNAVGRLIGRVNTSDFNPVTQALDTRTPFNDVAAMQRVAVFGGYNTFNTATESKLAEVNVPDSNKVLYVTAHDERVCHICMPFDGRIFQVLDASIPTLPQHENCRCFLEAII
jgi:hypothetical protein